MSEPTDERKLEVSKTEFQSDHNLIQHPYFDIESMPIDAPERKVAEFVNIMIFNHVPPISVRLGEYKKVLDDSHPNGWKYVKKGHDDLKRGRGWVVKPYSKLDDSSIDEVSFGVVILDNGTALHTVSDVHIVTTTIDGNTESTHAVQALADDETSKQALKSFISRDGLTAYLNTTIDILKNETQPGTKTKQQSGELTGELVHRTKVLRAEAAQLALDEISRQAAVEKQIHDRNENLKRISKERVNEFLGIVRSNNIPTIDYYVGPKQIGSGWLVQKYSAPASPNNLYDFDGYPEIMGLIVLENGRTYSHKMPSYDPLYGNMDEITAVKVTKDGSTISDIAFGDAEKGIEPLVNYIAKSGIELDDASKLDESTIL